MGASVIKGCRECPNLESDLYLYRLVYHWSPSLSVHIFS